MTREKRDQTKRKSARRETAGWEKEETRKTIGGIRRMGGIRSMEKMDMQKCNLGLVTAH